MMKLYFIRHGLSEANKAGIWSGQSETALSPEGRAQAKLAGQKAKDLGINLIVSSPLGRARETAEIIAKEIGYPHAKILFSDLLKERSWGDLEGTAHASVDRNVELDSIPNIETSERLLKRADEALRYLEGLPDEKVLAVSHGTFGRALRHHIIEDMPFVNKTGVPGVTLPNGEVICWI